MNCTNGWTRPWTVALVLVGLIVSGRTADAGPAPAFRDHEPSAGISARTALCSCPFCAAVNLTFAEQIAGNDVVVVAKLVEPAQPLQPDAVELPTAGLEIADVVKGAAFVREGMKFRAVLIGSYEPGQTFLVMGVDPPNLIWSTPLKASPRVIEYVNQLENLPPGGSKRLEFFQQYFEDPEPVLAFDAYDEFARASYADVTDLRDRMQREQILAWIQNPEIAVNRRRLYFTLLGVCGGPEDAEMLEGLIRSGDRQKQAGLDALVGCYLVLKGEAGLPLIEEQLLGNRDVDYVDTLSAVSAIRFMGSESTQIPRARLSQSLRTLLARPELADMIIPDLARWQDWSVLDRMVELFREAKGETVWLRVAIFQYLRECPLPEAKKYSDELALLDPKAFQRASFFTDFGFSDSPPASAAAGTPGEAGKSEAGGGEKDKGSGETADPKKDGAGGDGGSDSGKDGSAGGTLADPPEGEESAGIPQSPSAGSDDLTPVSLEIATDDPAPPAPAVGDRAENAVAEPVPAPAGSREEVEVPEKADGDEGRESPPESRSVQKPPVTLPPAVSNRFPPTEARPLRSSTVPEAATETVPASRLYPFALPVGSGMVIFLLLWSVINGWFERLIF